MNVAQFGNRRGHSKMKSPGMRLSPKSSMAGVLRTKGFGCLPTEKAICVQGTVRVGTTSQGHLEGVERLSLEPCEIKLADSLTCHTPTARSMHCHLTQLCWYLGEKILVYRLFLTWGDPVWVHSRGLSCLEVTLLCRRWRHGFLKQDSS